MHPVWLAFLVAACGSERSSLPPDGSSPIPDAGATEDAELRADAIVPDAQPGGCPSDGCPGGTYCDLARDRCVAGCLNDDDCGTGEICEDRACIAGCRDDASCGARHVCEGGVCVVGCRDCDETTECWSTACVEGECIRTEQPDGHVCAFGSIGPPLACVSASCLNAELACYDFGPGLLYGPSELTSEQGPPATSCGCNGTRMEFAYTSGRSGFRECEACLDYSFETSNIPPQRVRVVGCF